MPWDKKGFVQAEEQFLVKEATQLPSVAEVAKVTSTGKVEIVETSANIKTVKGKNFVAEFDTNTGTIYSLTYGNETVIAAGNGPKLDALRAFTNNDNWFYSQWFERGLHNLIHKATNSKFIKKADGTVVASFTVVSQAPNAARINGGTSSGKNSIDELTDKKFGENDFKFTTNQIFTVYPDGSIELQASISSNQEGLILPRLGYVMKVPQKYTDFSYYGRGPIDNYADRKSGQFVELHNGTVKDEFVNFPKPQSMGNHEDVRWCALTDKAKNGAVFVAAGRMSVSALQYSSLEMTLAPHAYQLPKGTDTYLHLDLGVTGLGGNSCGQGGPLEQDRVKAGQNLIGFIIRPAAGNELIKTAAVKVAGDVPVAITRNRIGEVKLFSAKKDAVICYSIGAKGKVKVYDAPIAMRDGGIVTAWLKENPSMKTTLTFTKIESVQTTVVFASSEEVGEGDAVNLTDGDPNTIWHTMYSVTVAKHPHWVDLDAGEDKMVKGFAYLPRQDGSTGNVKDYTIHASLDGKNWGEPVVKATFANNAAEKKVMFDKPVKARYIRFTALSEQRGRDFATGAELTLFAE